MFIALPNFSFGFFSTDKGDCIIVPGTRQQKEKVEDLSIAENIITEICMVIPATVLGVGAGELAARQEYKMRQNRQGRVGSQVPPPSQGSRVRFRGGRPQAMLAGAILGHVASRSSGAWLEKTCENFAKGL